MASSVAKRVAHTVTRFVIEVDDTFDNVRGRFAELVPEIDIAELSDVVKTGDPEAVRRYTAQHTPNSFAKFWTLDPTSVMQLSGNKSRAVTYLVGNNLIAETMYRHDAGVMLYAPIRVAIYTDAEDRTLVSFDQPSAHFGSFGNPDVAAVGRLLDRKIAAVLELLGAPAPAELTAPDAE